MISAFMIDMSFTFIQRVKLLLARGVAADTPALEFGWLVVAALLAACRAASESAAGDRSSSNLSAILAKCIKLLPARRAAADTFHLGLQEHAPELVVWIEGCEHTWLAGGPLIYSNLSWRSMRFDQIRGEGLGTTMSEDMVAPPRTDIVKGESLCVADSGERSAAQGVPIPLNTSVSVCESVFVGGGCCCCGWLCGGGVLWRSLLGVFARVGTLTELRVV